MARDMFGLDGQVAIVTGGNGGIGLGIAHALGLARDFVKDEKFCVFLGDNVLEGNTIEAKQSFESQEDGAKVLLKEVPDPENFGCPEIDHDRIVRVIEKPTNPPTSYAVIGIYFYDSNVFEFIETLQPSERGELEITSAVQYSIDHLDTRFEVIPIRGPVLDLTSRSDIESVAERLRGQQVHL